MTSRLLLYCDPPRNRLQNFPQPEYPGIREYFATIASRPEVALAYVSGRHRGLAEHSARRGHADILDIARDERQLQCRGTGWPVALFSANSVVA